MTALTDFAENQTINWLAKGATPTAPEGTLTVALITGGVEGTDSTDATAGTEVSGGSYARQPVEFTAAADGQVSNEALLRYDNMPDVPAPGVQGFEIWDSASPPRRWWHAPLTTARTYAAGDAAEFPAGELVLQIQ